MFRLTTLIAAVASFAVAAPVGAQSQWLGPSPERAFWLEMIRPAIDDADLGFATSVWQAGARIPLRQRVALVAEIPFAYADLDLDPSDESGTAGLGNPYLGLEFVPTSGCLRADVGVRAPLAPDDNVGMAIGFLGDFVERAEAFVPDVVPITFGVVHACPVGESGWSARIRGAGSVWVPVDGGDTDVMALYGVQGWYERGLVIGAGVTGRALLTADGGFAERTVHQIGGTVGYDFGSVRPMIELRVPIDESLRETVPYTIGVGVVIRR